MSGPEASFALWSAPCSPITVYYSLPLFHEIDFTVNEGYRRIPHGGVEVGGLLFGRLEGQIVQIEQSRPILCEYAHGPSFVLSGQDTLKLRQQLSGASQDPELTGLIPLGWFIGHTRHPLHIGDQEAALFDELFPHPGQITLLVKPERFKPTLFGFIVRGLDLRYDTDASKDPIILPLLSRGDFSPVLETATPMDAPDTVIEEPEIREPAPVREEHTLHSPAIPEIVTPAPEPEPATYVRPDPLPSLNDIRRRRLENLPNSAPSALDSRPAEAARRPLPRPPQASSRITVFLTLTAGLFVIAIAPWLYLQISADAIPLRVTVHGSKLLVDWPDSQTRRLPLATLQVGNQPPLRLTVEQMQAGQAEVDFPASDLRVELVIHHWYQQRRGVVRFSKAAPPVATRPAKAGAR